MTIINLNFAEIAETAFQNILGSPGVVRDGVVYSIDADGNETATDTPEQAIKDEMDRVKNEVQYRHERANEYPDLKEQLDQLWHAMDADETKRLEPFYSTIKAVKDAYPKDGTGNTPIEIVDDEPQLDNLEVSEVAPDPNFVPPEVEEEVIPEPIITQDVIEEEASTEETPE